MASVLVTGGAGSMGRLVCNRLASRGHAIRAFDLETANFKGLPDGVSALTGDLTSKASLESAINNVDAVVHLAAILPPVADQEIELARLVNVRGTEILIDAMRSNNPTARLVFSSSVSVYGKPTTDDEVSTSMSYNPDDNYAKTKSESEQLVLNSGIDSCVLRISGVSVPVFQEPPDAWPFLPDQKIEFIHRDDAVTAITSAVTTELTDATRIINVSGGDTWRMQGSQYVADYFKMIEVDPDQAVYQSSEGHFAWYSDEGGNSA
ncbi:MAG: NAD(P)-dependent oxidoreductase, partial [Dehalococcoidia bacterium]|nr:NAD(P)-dependent oxidoreductase [Dehalococcoidia bacterium]